MNKLLIGSLVGGIILFIWQFLSWGPLQVHRAEFQYTPNEDAILEVLSANLPEDGGYFVPGIPPGTSSEKEQELMAAMDGKPWATINYHKAYELNFGMNLLRGFAVDFVAILLLCWVLMKIPNLDFKTTLLSSLAVGAIAYMTIPYLNSIWFEGNTVGYIVDLIVGWGLIGAWLGWWLNR